MAPLLLCAGHHAAISIGVSSVATTQAKSSSESPGTAVLKLLYGRAGRLCRDDPIDLDVLGCVTVFRDNDLLARALASPTLA
jgi:hypothetical protein